MSRMVRRRVALPPYSGSGALAPVVGSPVVGSPVAGVALVAGMSWAWSAVIGSSASRCALVASPDHLMIARRADLWPAESWAQPDGAASAARPAVTGGDDRDLRYDDVSYRFRGH